MNKYKNKYLFIIFLLLINGINLIYNKDKKIIFTFWEPKEKIPGYLSLCIKTWKKFLPEYKIIILDYETLKKLIGEKMFNSIICKDMSLMVQTDAIRVAILNKFGGIWMDTDDIVTNGKFIKSFPNNELVMIKDHNGPFIGFIYASKNSTIIKRWLEEIIKRVKKFREVTLNKTNTTDWYQSFEEVNAWNYLGNGILNNLVINTTSNKYFGVDHDKIKIFPELHYIKNSSLDFYEKYKKFFFEKGDPQLVLNISKDLVFLFNSWTDLKYKQMSEDEFLHQDILLSKLLSKLLDINT